VRQQIAEHERGERFVDAVDDEARAVVAPEGQYVAPRFERRAQDRQIRSEVEGKHGARAGGGHRRPSIAHVAEADEREPGGRHRSDRGARSLDAGDGAERHVTPQQSQDGQRHGFDQAGDRGDLQEARELFLAVEIPDPRRDQENHGRHQSGHHEHEGERRPDVVAPDLVALDQELRTRELAQAKRDRHDRRADHGDADLGRGEQAHHQRHGCEADGDPQILSRGGYG
jgi:hypothetical protein